MATNFRVKIDKIGLLTFNPSFVALAFLNGLEYRNSDFKNLVNSGGNRHIPANHDKYLLVFFVVQNLFGIAAVVLSRCLGTRMTRNKDHNVIT